MKTAIVSSAAMFKADNWSAAYWIKRLEEQEEVNRILRLIGLPEEEPEGRLIQTEGIE